MHIHLCTLSASAQVSLLVGQSILLGYLTDYFVVDSPNATDTRNVCYRSSDGATGLDPLCYLSPIQCSHEWYDSKTNCIICYLQEGDDVIIEYRVLPSLSSTMIGSLIKSVYCE